MRAVVVRTPGRERIEDLIERTILIQAAKESLGTGDWFRRRLEIRDGGIANRHRSESIRKRWWALAGSNESWYPAARASSFLGILAGDGAQSGGEAGFQSINAGRGLTLRRGGADGFMATVAVGVDWFWVAMPI